MDQSSKRQYTNEESMLLNGWFAQQSLLNKVVIDFKDFVKDKDPNSLEVTQATLSHIADYINDQQLDIDSKIKQLQEDATARNN